MYDWIKGNTLNSVIKPSTQSATQSRCTIHNAIHLNVADDFSL